MTQLIKQARRRRAPSNIGLGEDVGHDSSWFFRFEYPMLIVGGHGWLRFVESPVLQCEGPGAPEGSWYPRCPKARHLHPTDEDLSVGAPAWGTRPLRDWNNVVTIYRHPAAPRLKQRLDHLQAPGLNRDNAG